MMASTSGSLYEELIGCILTNMQTSVPGQVDFIHCYLQQILHGFRREPGPPERLARLCQCYTGQSGDPRKSPELIFVVDILLPCLLMLETMMTVPQKSSLKHEIMLQGVPAANLSALKHGLVYGSPDSPKGAPWKQGFQNHTKPT